MVGLTTVLMSPQRPLRQRTKQDLCLASSHDGRLQSTTIERATLHLHLHVQMQSWLCMQNAKS
jgi:hypothetical protein